MGRRFVIEREDFGGLFGALTGRGYTIIGPTLRDGAIILDEIQSVEDLPAGWTDEQDGGHFRLHRRDDDALFGYAVGPHSFKSLRVPARRTLFSARIDERGGLADVSVPPPDERRLALLGPRSCELHADRILQRVLGDGGQPAEPRFVVAVQCAQAGGTCFCVSMGTGPVADRGFDLAITELLDAEGHRFVVEVGSGRGAGVLSDVRHRPADQHQVGVAEQVHAGTAAQMGRRLDTDGLRELLFANLEHPRWDEVAERCLSCGNCTMVCPTCFCTSVEDVTDLAGERVERREQWDSCFTVDYSHVHGGAVRSSGRSRYRQWMTHKLASWWDQFDSSGCVGCGRCITWCPVGIDITEEAAAIRAEAGSAASTKPTHVGPAVIQWGESDAGADAR